jgi:nucleotide-binding universal stress UspA family protein
MSKKNAKEEVATTLPTNATPATPEARLEAAQQVSKQFSAATTKDEVVAVINSNVGVLGHRVINRILLGSTPEKALRLDKAAG